MTVLHIENLNLWYGKFHALKNISLPAFQPGEFIGVLGPNAAGKSTLLKALNGLHTAKLEISIDGRPIDDYSRDKRMQLFGLMTQTPPQPSALTPYELMWSIARAVNTTLSDKALEDRIEQLFSTFGLMEEGMQPLNTLSGGKRQLVGAVMVLIRSPSICLLDEPTSALDLHWRLIVLDELRNYIKSEGKLALAALHDLNLAARYCDRLLLIDEGELIAVGTPAEVLTRENISSVFHVETALMEGSDGRLHIEIIKPIKQIMGS